MWFILIASEHVLIDIHIYANPALFEPFCNVHVHVDLTPLGSLKSISGFEGNQIKTLVVKSLEVYYNAFLEYPDYNARINKALWSLMRLMSSSLNNVFTPEERKAYPDIIAAARADMKAANPHDRTLNRSTKFHEVVHSVDTFTLHGTNKTREYL